MKVIRNDERGSPAGTTAGSSLQVTVHLSPRFVTEWIDEEDYG